ncbi:uncharacterized protein LOC116290852 [Actinia tenebrosa]|uniref:Uncharacterized protein LOC116290852 n=1 Tax=Actinia tenebrosa TaxID=6105 RepID=A0A6P8HMF0_ACTTE|nr:uncharacterized protein LOC116290852 [Actinia tenebrosa]XP_031553825.1 uncharacterized protein LOC116290852 [Actinia tenebrosa]
MSNQKVREIQLHRLTSFSCVPGPSACAVGLENKEIPDDSITASSTAEDSAPYYARLNYKRGAWCPKLTSEDPYLQIDLGTMYDVTEVATQGIGNTGADRFVKAYKLQYSRDGKEWEYHQEGERYSQILKGNNDSVSIVRRVLSKPFRTRFVRFYPVEWIGKPCMRVEVYGIQVGKATFETTVNVTDLHGNGLKGTHTLQFCLQLFGEDGYTRKLPLEIEANSKEKNQDILVFKRKILAADVGWIQHLKLSYENSKNVQDDTRPSLVQKLRRMSSIMGDDDMSNGESGLFIDEITIDVKETGQHFTFPCKQWLIQGPTAFDPAHRHKSRQASSNSYTVNDQDFDHILHQEAEETEGWHKRKTPSHIQSWRRQPNQSETTTLTKTTFNIDGIPYDDAVRLLTDWNLRVKWDQTFRKVIVIEENVDSDILYCCLKMPPLFRPWEVVLSVMNKAYHTPDRCHVIAWCSTEHSSVSTSEKATLGRVQVRLSGMVIRPIGDDSGSCKATLLTRMRSDETTPRPIKNTYLNGRPAQWVKYLQEYYVEHGAKEPEVNGSDEVFGDQ